MGSPEGVTPQALPTSKKSPIPMQEEEQETNTIVVP